ERPFVLAGLNHVLGAADLTDNLPQSELNLSREARQLLTKPARERTPAETERLNRLVLEAAYPGTIRQLDGRRWREVLLVYGGGGLLVALPFWVIVRDRPGAHPWANAAARLSEDGAVPAPRGALPGIPWRLLVRSRNMWLSGLTQFGIN